MALLAALAVGSAGAAQPPAFANRLLLVFGPADGSGAFDLQMSRARDADCGIRERAMKIVPLTGDRPTTIDGQRVFPGSLRQSFGVAEGAFAAILIGKDGTEKFRADQPVRMAEIFDRIDAMPMRREEMRRARAVGAAPCQAPPRPD